MEAVPSSSRMLRVHPLDVPCVALEVTASGSDPAKGRLLGVEAVKFQGQHILDRFSSPAGPDLVIALPRFLGDALLVGHGLADGLGHLAAHGVRPGNSWLDLREMATVLLPDAPDTSLPGLARRLLSDGEPAPDGMNAPDYVGAPVDTVRRVYLALVERAQGMDAAVLHRLAALVGRLPGSLGLILTALADTAAGTGAPGGIDFRELARRLERPRPVAPLSQRRSVDPEEVAALLSPEGPLGRRFPRYEPREEQVAMARAVAAAFNGPGEQGEVLEPRSLMVEGGTGIGKSVAYLLPAILYAVRNNARVVVSTNTINLQEQLVQKDIPDLLDALRDSPGVDVSRFRFAQMKGKANYLCLRRWEQMAAAETLTAEEARTLARTLVWLRDTETGDRAELRLQGRELGVWERLSAAGFSQCPGARDGACFYRHTRELAAGAHLLVVNHALLLADLQVDGTLLPEYDHLIVDEAHHLEDEATRQFGFRVAQTTLEELVERLSSTLQGLGSALRGASLDAGRGDALQRRMEEALHPLPGVRDHWAQLIASLAAFAAEHRLDGADGESDLRITASSRAQPAWSELEVVWDNFDRSLGEVGRRTAALLRSMEDLPEGALPGGEETALVLGDWLQAEAELRQRLTDFVSRPEETTVYWIGQGGGPLTVNGAPLEVGPRLQGLLFSQKRVTVLTSATLSAGGGSFDHMRQRLGLEGPEELCLGSPFDYRQAALLCVPNDMPEPSSPVYQETLVRAILGLAKAAQGHTMALFTSHAAVRAARDGLQGPLADQGIAVLAQVVDGSPQQLVARFQEEPRAVLLGTSSFWEGVDIANGALKVLVLARLPFNVPTEPIFAARSQLYEKPFPEYALPMAVLRFRQGFGRLIRSRDDRGAVVVLDGRVRSRGYGKWFLGSVPATTGFQGPVAGVPEAVRRWLARPETQETQETQVASP